MDNKNIPAQLLSNSTYNILKWVVAIVIPAITTLVGAIGSATGLANLEVILTIMVAVNTFLGTVLGVSTVQYNNNNNK